MDDLEAFLAGIPIATLEEFNNRLDATRAQLDVAYSKIVPAGPDASSVPDNQSDEAGYSKPEG